MKEAIILAGGMGTRLRTVITDVPKPLAPVGGIPFLYHVLLWLEKYKTEKIIISAGYKSDTIISCFGDSFHDIPIEYAVEEKPLGTGGAISFALRKTKGEEILIINGDTYFPIDLSQLYSSHIGNRHVFTIALKRMKDFSRYGSVECEGDKILKFNEKKSCSEGLINGGVYLVSRQFFESVNMPEVYSLEKDLLEKEVGSGKLSCMTFDDPFIDIGIPEDYQRAQTLLKIR